MARRVTVVRESKYRHVFCEADKPELHHTDLNLSSTSGDHSYIKGNTKFFSVAMRGGGGPVLVQRLDQPGKLSPTAPVLAGHAAAVSDTDWNPFNEHQLVTASHDATIKLWDIPEEGLTDKLTESSATLAEHSKAVTFVQWHPSASGVLASAAKDQTVLVWDVAAGASRTTLSGFSGLVQDLVWNYDGSALATASKDKFLRLWDPRSGGIAAETQPHDSVKTFKITYLGNCSKILTVGFNRQSKREFMIWDPRNLSEHVSRTELDQSGSVILPFFDSDTGILYLAGKGDGNIRYYEFVDEAPYIHPIEDYRTTVPAKGMCMLPKRAVDVSKCEIARFLKLTANSVEELHFIVPRKDTTFAEDIYPPAVGSLPGLSANSWFSGEDKVAPKISLKPEDHGSVAVAATTSANPAARAPAPPVKQENVTAAAQVAETTSAAAADEKKRIVELEKEVETLRNRIAELEIENAKLKEAGAESSAATPTVSAEDEQPVANVVE